MRRYAVTQVTARAVTTMVRPVTSPLGNGLDDDRMARLEAELRELRALVELLVGAAPDQRHGDLLSLKEASRLLKVSDKTVRRMAKTDPSALRIGGKIFFRRAVLLKTG